MTKKEVSQARLPWLQAWLVTFVLIQAGELVIRQFREPISKFHVIVYALSVITSLVLWYLTGRLFHYLESGWPRQLGAAVVAFLATLLLFSSFHIYGEFGEFITADMLAFVAADPQYFWEFVQVLLLNWAMIPFVMLWGGLTALWLWRSEAAPSPIKPRRDKRHIIITLLTVVGFAASLVATLVAGRSFHNRLEASLVVAVPRFIANVAKSKESLRPANRLPVEVVESPTSYNVLVILNESWGRQFLGMYEPGATGMEVTEPGMPSLEAWIAERPNETFVFQRFFTNSGATDVSVPSIMTGVAPYEPVEKLHRMPLPWQWARGNGMSTVLTTSQRYTWANFNGFFLSNPPDFYATADTISAPVVNDTGIDDLIAVRAFGELVRKAPTDRPLFAIYGTNATHGPFQQGSDLAPDLPARPTRYSRALTVADAAIARALAAMSDFEGDLEESNTIVIITADHATTENTKHLPRLYSFYDESVQIPFIIYVPPSLIRARPEVVEHLRANQLKTASNIDIIPTIVDLLGLDQSPQNARILAELAGRSLARPLPDDSTVVALNTNDVRSWSNEGFGIYRHDLRFVYSNIEGPKLFDVSNDRDQEEDLWPNADEATRAWILEKIAGNKQLRRMYGDASAR